MTEIYLVGTLAVLVMLVFIISLLTRKSAIVLLIALLVSAVGFRVYLFKFNHELESQLWPYVLHFWIGVGVAAGLFLFILIWPLFAKIRRDERICRDWQNEGNVLERFRKRLAYETYARDMNDIRVWRRRNLNVVIRAPKYQGEYVLPPDVEADLDLLTLDEMVSYRQPTIIDEKPVNTGIATLDALLDTGAYKGDLIANYAVAKGGKTTSLLVLIANIVGAGGRVLLVTVEMQRPAVLKALYPYLPEDAPTDAIMVVRAGVGQGVDTVMTAMDQKVAGRNVDIVLVDGVDLMQTAKGVPDKHEHDRTWAVLCELKKWAVNLGFPVWVSLQSARDGKLKLQVQSVPDYVFKVHVDGSRDRRNLTMELVKSRYGTQDGGIVRLAIFPSHVKT